MGFSVRTAEAGLVVGFISPMSGQGFCDCCPECAGSGDGGTDDGGRPPSGDDDDNCGTCKSMCSDSGGCYEVSGKSPNQPVKRYC